MALDIDRLIWVGLDRRRNEQVLPKSASVLYVDDLVLEELVLEYAVRIYCYCRRMLNDATTAKDITQDTFVKVYRRNIRGPRWLSYLLRVAYCLCIDDSRRVKPISLDDVEAYSENTDAALVSRDPEPDELLLMGENHREFLNWLHKVLPDQQCAVIILYYDDYSIKETASILRLSERTVKNYRYIAFQKIAAALAQRGERR